MPGIPESDRIVKRVILPETALYQPGGLADYEEAVEDQQGVSITVCTQYLILDRLGRLVPPSQFTSFSWTSTPTPQDMQGQCANPWHHHAHRIVFVNHDGMLMPSGIILCMDCIEQNSRLERLRKLLWIFYNPVTY